DHASRSVPSRRSSDLMPSFWARNFEHLDIARGERVLQIGAGSGYYSAVLAEIVGPAGQVTAVEVDPALADRARINLESWPQVQRSEEHTSQLQARFAL